MESQEPVKITRYQLLGIIWFFVCQPIIAGIALVKVVAKEGDVLRAAMAFSAILVFSFLIAGLILIRTLKPLR